MTSLRIVFALSPHQNAFFPELVEVLCDEIGQLGVPWVVTLDPGEHEVLPSDIFVVCPPHEYLALEGPAWFDDPVVAGRTIGLSAEQPHQVFFSRNAQLAAQLGGVMDFSRAAVDAYRRLGIDAHHLLFGWTARWDRFVEGRAPDGPPRVLYMGNKAPRRLGELAQAAGALCTSGTRLLISDNAAPNRGSGPAFVAGELKRRLLASTRLLVNIHQSATGYFEWLRFAEAAHCGSPFLTEASDDTHPYRAAEHFAVFAPGGLAAAIETLADNDARLQDLRTAAYQQLRATPLAAGARRLVEVAESLLDRPAPAQLPRRTRARHLPHAVEYDWPTVVAPGAPRGRRQAPSVTLLGDGSPELWAALRQQSPDASHLSPMHLTERRVRRRAGMRVLLAAPGTAPLGDGVNEMLASVDGSIALVTAVVAGRDRDGAPTLEGFWPFEGWRVAAGGHAGRLLAVDGELVRAAASWLADPIFAGAPHVALAAWVARHGLATAHLPYPVAEVRGTPLDPQHLLPEEMATEVRRRLGARPIDDAQTM